MENLNDYLTISHLNKQIDGTTILNDISFTAKKGEFVSLLGPSGCGKSSLLRSISGLMTIDSGSVLLDGTDITHLSPQKRHISMVFQNYALFPNMTVYKNIEFGLKVQKEKLSRIERDRLVNEMVELVDLKKHLHKYPHQLSGGQCQRVALAL